MPKNSNIFKSWFKAKQKEKKSIDESSIKQSPLLSRLSNNENQSTASPKRKTSLFGIQFNLTSSNNSSKLSIISTGNKQNEEESSHQIDNQSQKSVSSLVDSKNSNKETSTKKKKTKILINSNNQKTNNTSMNILQQLAQRFNPGKNSRSINSSPQNISSGNLTSTIPKSPKNNQIKINEELNKNSIKQATFSLVKNEASNSAFTRVNSINKNSIDSKHLFNSNKNTSQQQKQLQFQQQRFLNKSTNINNQNFNQQKPSFNEQEVVTAHSKNVSVISSSGLITTINESFIESTQDSSDAEIVEVFSKNEKQDSLNENFLLLKEMNFNEKGSQKHEKVTKSCVNTKFLNDIKNTEHESYLQDKNNNLNLFKNDTKIIKDKENDKNIEKSFDDTFKKNLDKIEMSLIIQDSKLDIQDDYKNNQAFLETVGDLDNLSELNYNEEDYAFYENKKGLGEDLKFLAFMPELCDITFLVGETREPVCAVGAVLGSRSKVFYKLLYGQKAYSNQQYYNENDLQNEKSTLTKSTRRSIFSRKESIFDNEINAINDSKRSREDTNRRSLLRYSKSKKLKENKEAKLKLFLKRGSEPMLNGLPLNQQIQPLVHQTMIIEEFEPDVFRQLIEYIHTGIVVLQARTLLGLMNAADYYGLEELRKACMGFVTACISVDTVCALLAGAERYIQYKCTKSLVQRVLEFVDNHGNEVLSLGSFTLLPEHVVRLILSREELKAEELIKFQAVLQWSQRYCDGSPGAVDLREVVKGFFECIEFYKIPATVLMREVHPLNIVPDHIIMNALAYQADPKSIDICKVESPNRFRRMTLPHALNISGSDLLNLHRQSLVPFKSERSASTSTSGYNTECSMFSTNNTSSGNLVLKKSFKRKKGEKEEEDNLDDQDKKNQKSKNKDKQNKVGKRRGSRPFRRAMTLFEGK